MTLFAAIAACDRTETAAGPPAVAIRDSAGIEIVENHAPAWDAGGAWMIAGTPEVVIGGYRDVIEADSAHLVWHILDVAALSDGRVALLSYGEKKVLLFESSGTFVTSIGRVGRGPGEYRNPVQLQVLPGDTIVVWDFMFGPVSYFDPSGRFLKSRLIDVGEVFAAVQKPNRMSPEGVYLPLADGSFVVAGGLIPGDFIPPWGEPYRVPSPDPPACVRSDPRHGQRDSGMEGRARGIAGLDILGPGNGGTAAPGPATDRRARGGFPRLLVGDGPIRAGSVGERMERLRSGGPLAGYAGDTAGARGLDWR